MTDLEKQLLKMLFQVYHLPTYVIHKTSRGKRDCNCSMHQQNGADAETWLALHADNLQTLRQRHPDIYAEAINEMIEESNGKTAETPCETTA